MIENGASKRKTESKVDDDLKQSKREAAKRKRETLAKRVDDDLNLCNVKRFLSADSFVRHFVIICDVMRVFFCSFSLSSSRSTVSNMYKKKKLDNNRNILEKKIVSKMQGRVW